MHDKKIKIQKFELHYDHSKPIVFKHLSLNGHKIIENPLELNFFNVILKAFVMNKLEKDDYSVTPNLSVCRKNIDNKETLVLQYLGSDLFMNKIDVMELQSIIEKLLSRIDIFAEVYPSNK